METNTEFEDPLEIKFEVDPASLLIETETETKTKTEFDMILTNTVQILHHNSEELILPNFLSPTKHEIEPEVDPLATDSEELTPDPVEILISSSHETEEQDEIKRAKKAKLKIPDLGRSSSFSFIDNLPRQNFGLETKENQNSNKNNDDGKNSSCSEATSSQASVKDAGLRSLSLPFTCFECLKKFPTKPALKSHIDQSHSTIFSHSLKPTETATTKRKSKAIRAAAAFCVTFKCHASGCNEVFFSPSALDLHTRSHKKAPDLLKCSICPGTFEANHLLKRHMSLHQNITPFKCSSCSLYLKSALKLKYHLWSPIHNPDPDPDPIPDGRESVVEFVSESEEEKEEEEPEQDPLDIPLETSIHSESTTKSNSSNVKKRFSCDICGLSYVTQSGLAKHNKTRAENAPLQCTKCPYKSCSMSLLALHVRRDHAITPYKCPQKDCAKAFTTYRKMREHRRRDHTSKVFECAECKTSYKYALGLQVHLEEYHGERRKAEEELEAKISSFLKEGVGVGQEAEPELVLKTKVNVKQEAETELEMEAKPELLIKKEVSDAEYEGLKAGEENSEFVDENIVIKLEDIKVMPDIDFFR